eukprot:6761533-Alexandrium_andersonii.AAC.1
MAKPQALAPARALAGSNHWTPDGPRRGASGDGAPPLSRGADTGWRRCAAEAAVEAEAEEQGLGPGRATDLSHGARGGEALRESEQST